VGDHREKQRGREGEKTSHVLLFDRRRRQHFA